MGTHYIRMSASGDPLFHVAASDLPYDRKGEPKFVTAPGNRKQWYKAANLDQPPLGDGEQYGSAVYEDLGQPEATIRYPVVVLPPPPPPPLAPPPPVGTTIAALRAEVAALRQSLIDAGRLVES